MSLEISKKKCPFCHHSAFVSAVETEPEFPSDIIQVQCDRCGEYHLLAKEVKIDKESLHIDSIKKLPLDLDRIARMNRYSQSEGKVILWLASFEAVTKWQNVIADYANHHGSFKPYELRVILDYQEY